MKRKTKPREKKEGEKEEECIKKNEKSYQKEKI